MTARERWGFPFLNWGGGALAKESRSDVICRRRLCSFPHAALLSGMEAADPAGVAGSSPELAVCGDLMVVTGGAKLLAALYKEPG